MSEIFDYIKARSLITNLQKTDDNNLVYSTKLHGAKLFSAENCSVKANFSNQFLNQDTTAVAFNNNGNLIAFSNNKTIYIADLTKKEILKTIITDSKKIQLLTFDETSNYIIAGNENGRVIQYNCISSSALSRLCSFPYNETDRKRIRKNYVSAFAINKNRLATSGLGGSIIIIDMYSRANKIVLHNSRSRINALHFIDDNTLISGNFDGLITIYSIKEKKILAEIETPLIRIRQIISMPNPNYIMVCSNSNFISIVDIKKHKMLHHNYIEFNDSVIKLANIDDKNVAVALKNGMIHKIELSTGENIKSFILHNSLDKAYKLIDKEPMLKDTKEYHELEKIYKGIYKKAIVALINQNISMAKELLDMFIDLPSKRHEISSLFIAFKNYNNLKVLYVGKKISVIYALVSRYPELEHTPIFKKVEEFWRDDFKNAQRQMLQGKIGKANFLLDKYKTIPAKKEMVNLVLNQNKEFIQFILALDKKDYALASQMSKKNKLLTKAPSYKILENEIEYKIDQIKTFIYQGDTQKAKIAISIIENVPHLKKQIEYFLKECEHLELLQKYYEKNDFKRCYETLDMYPYLYTTELGEMLEKHWKGIIQKCEHYAMKGNVSDIKKTLGELMMLEGRVDKVGDLFRLSFHVRMKVYFSKRSFKEFEKLIYTYTDTFGLDHEVSQLMKKYELKTKQKLAITQDVTTNRNSWLYSDFVK
ncbi:hypothetical protein [Sulfurimonas sp.]|uniref:hypothetical protein n=1 Tax=Sulfurimonas sp. TaxID=2022749 RepID=UPI003561AB32